MESSTSANTLLIKAGGMSGFLYEMAKFDGYDYLLPYKPAGLFMRIVREICFRMPLLPKTIWYNRSIARKNYSYVLVWDILVTVDFLIWLSHCLPNAQLNFLYGNKVGLAHHIMPSQIPPMYRRWSYDMADCEKYGLRLSITTYHNQFVRPLKLPKYDVLFVGRDKGRLPFLLEIEKELTTMGLIPKFVIVKDGRFSSKKPEYQNEISYDDLLNLITESRSVLNISMPGQNGITMRDVETLFFGVKLLTTNSDIVKADFYNPNNVFVIRDKNLNGLHDFLSVPFQPIERNIIERRCFKYGISKITSDL